MTDSQIYDSGATICAISTPPGTGGIAVARISGPDAIATVDSIWHGTRLSGAKSHTAHLGEIYDPDSRNQEPLDQCVATIFRAPHSYTGEDTVEISVHGSRWIQRELIALLCRKGCRMALPGEFTRRALTNGRLDLPRAEAVADIIASSSRAAHRLAMLQLKGTFSQRISALRDNLLQLATLLELELDFSEEDVEFADRERLRNLAGQIATELKRLHSSYAAGSAIKEGIPVAIAGATNAGKSSLLNLLLDDDRAIVSDIHGTTRDTIEETLEIGDYLYRIIDTAGLRDTPDPIERMGIERTISAISRAAIVIILLDPLSSTPLPSIPATGEGVHIIYAINKTDIATSGQIARARNLIPAGETPAEISAKTGAGLNNLRQAPVEISAKTGAGLNELRHASVEISAKTGAGLNELRQAILQATPSYGSESADIMVTNARHAEALREASDEAALLLEALDANLPTDLIAEHLRHTISHLSIITGTIPTPEILQNIFQNFCIGK